MGSPLRLAEGWPVGNLLALILLLFLPFMEMIDSLLASAVEKRIDGSRVGLKLPPEDWEFLMEELNRFSPFFSMSMISCALPLRVDLGFDLLSSAVDIMVGSRGMPRSTLARSGMSRVFSKDTWLPEEDIWGEKFFPTTLSEKSSRSLAK